MQLVWMPTTTSPTRTTKMLHTKPDEVYVTHATAMRRGAAIADVRRSTLMGGVGARRLGRARPRKEIDRVPCKNRLRTRVDAARASSSRFTLAITSNLQLAGTSLTFLSSVRSGARSSVHRGPGRSLHSQRRPPRHAARPDRSETGRVLFTHITASVRLPYSI